MSTKDNMSTKYQWVLVHNKRVVLLFVKDNERVKKDRKKVLYWTVSRVRVKE